MSLPIHVDAYSGHKANERPRQFTLDEVVCEIAAVLDQWYEPSAARSGEKRLLPFGPTVFVESSGQRNNYTLENPHTESLTLRLARSGTWLGLVRRNCYKVMKDQG